VSRSRKPAPSKGLRFAGDPCPREGRQLLVGVGDLSQRLPRKRIDALSGHAACLISASLPVRRLVLIGSRRKTHKGSDTHAQFPSVNAVFSDPPSSFSESVAQLSAFGKKLVALGDEKHHPLAFWITHREGNKARLRFQPPPMSGIALPFRRMWRH
jgi:hypothetical protein